MTITPKRWVAPFGNPRIKVCSQLPVAYRSVLRPSSPLSAKASTKCPYALDCEMSCAGRSPTHAIPRDSFDVCVSPRRRQSRRPKSPALIVVHSTTPPFTMSKSPRLKEKPHAAAAGAAPAKLVIQTRACLPMQWWRRTDSNRRPPGCKPGALPTELRPLMGSPRSGGDGGPG